MVSTEQVRGWWQPACEQAGNTTIDFGDAGARITVDEITVPIWRAVEAIFADHDYTIRQGDTGAYNCRIITGGTGYSLHAYGIAVDVNWSTNPYGPTLRTDMPPGAVRAIEALNVDGTPVIRWGGRYSGNKDAMHFEVVVPPSTAVKFHYEAEEFTVANIDELVEVERAQGRKTRRTIAHQAALGRQQAARIAGHDDAEKDAKAEVAKILKAPDSDFD